MTSVRLAAAFAALVAFTGPAGAVSFGQADRNRDSLVTYPEARRVFQGLAEVHFEKCDPDGDGAIDRGEFPLLNNFYTLVYINTN
jgi:hypothetical protein